MCRFFAYQGSPAPLSRWVLESSHSLERQAYRPKDMVRGHVNVDGTGLAWWPAAEAVPLRYVTGGPPWSDPNLRTLLPRLSAPSQLAAVRSASPGMGYGIEHVQPFVHGEIALVHNGWIGGFRGALGHEMLSGLDPAHFADLPAFNDSAALFAAFLGALETARGSLEDALTATVTSIVTACERHREPCSLNLAVTSGRRSVAVRIARGVDANTLYTSERPEGRLLASEPLDEGTWSAVPENQISSMTASTIDSRDL